MWEALLSGMDMDIAKEDLRFQPSRIANPYREVFFKDFNKPVIAADQPVEVNAFYRYGDVFGTLLLGEMEGYTELRSVLFDILTHYLSELDFRSGLCRDEYYAWFLRGDVAAGLYGAKNAERLDCFSRKEKRLVCAGLLRLYKVGASSRLFAQLLREIYPRSITYLDVRGIRELLIYIGQKRTKALTAQMELLCDLFVPADYDVKLFWDAHFGLIDTLETMEIGRIMMY
jgi:hypothetical protein